MIDAILFATIAILIGLFVIPMLFWFALAMWLPLLEILGELREHWRKGGP